MQNTATFGARSTAEQVTLGLALAGRTWLVTGCNSGLGLETMRVIALRGGRVIGTARTIEKAREACDSVPGDTLPVVCELSEPDSVRKAVQDVIALGHPLSGLVANAGIMALAQREVKHDLELQFLTNHVGHFILVTGLLGQLAPHGRVVMLSSGAHTMTWSEGIRFDDLAAARAYKPWSNYGQSKLANLLFAKELATRLPAGQTANAVHPGVIATNLGRHMNPVVRTAMKLTQRLWAKSVPQGAATETLVATHPTLAKVSGEYFADCQVTASSEHARDPALATELWRVSEEIVARL